MKSQAWGNHGRVRARGRDEMRQGALSTPRVHPLAALLVAGASVLVALSVCAQTPNDVPEATVQQPLQTRARSGDSPGRQALAVYWESRVSSERTTVLRAQLQNATGASKEVSVSLMGVDPHGEIVTRALGTYTVDAKSSVPLRIPIADLPVQSADLSSMVNIVASCQMSFVTPDGTGRARSYRFYATPLHVTFDSDWKGATVRSTSEQAKLNGVQFQRAAPRAGRLRRYNRTTDRVEDIAAPAAGAPARPVMVVVDGPPSAPSRAAAAALDEVAGTEGSEP